MAAAVELTTVASDPIERDRWGRPLIAQPDTGELLPYTRASTVGKAIEDTFHLSKWQQRQVLRGVHVEPTLLLEMDRLANEPDRGDAEAYKAWKDAVDELVERAHQAIGSHDRADLGTYLHAVFEAIDNGTEIPAVPAQFADRYTVAKRDRDAAARSLATQGWRWLTRELFVVNDTWQVAGTLDGLTLIPIEDAVAAEESGPVLDGYLAMQTEGVTHLIRTADDKTGASMDFAGLGYCAQVAVYTDSLIYDPQTGERTTFHSLLPEDVDPARVRLDTEVAVIVHTPLGEGRCDVYRVPLSEGRAAVAMATDVREMRKVSRRWLRKVSGHQVEAPADEAPVTAPNTSDPVDRISDLIAAATSVDELLAIREREMRPVDYGRGPVIPWTAEHEALAEAHAALLSTPKPVDPVLAEIEAAMTVDAVVAIWTRETERGAWTPEREAAAAARAAVLNTPPY